MFRSRQHLKKNLCKGKPLGLAMAAEGVIVMVLVQGGGGGLMVLVKVGGGEWGKGVCMQCLLPLKSGLRETRNGGEIGAAGAAGEFGGGGGATADSATVSLPTLPIFPQLSPPAPPFVPPQSAVAAARSAASAAPAKMAAAGSAAAAAEITAGLVQQGSSSSSPAPAPRTPPDSAKEGIDIVLQGSSKVQVQLRARHLAARRKAWTSSSRVVAAAD